MRSIVMPLAGASNEGRLWARATLIRYADIRTTHDLPQRGVSRSGRMNVMAVDRFCRNTVGPPEWECEAMGSVVWVQCTNLCRVYIKSIDSRARG
mgnify:CR=1 FL=1